MDNYTYSAEFEHGGAQGSIRADSAADAEAKVKAMYDGQSRDTGADKDGNPTTEKTVVTKVIVKLVKE